MSRDALAQTLPQWLAHNATARAHEVGQRHKCDGIWREFRWQQIANEVHALAFGLVARNVKRGDTVLLISENRPELYWAEWAAMALGAKAVALYPDATEAEIEYIVEDSGAVCIFAEDQEQVDKAQAVAARHAGVHSIVWWEPGGLWRYHEPVLLSLQALKTAGQALAKQDANFVTREIKQGAAGDIALLSYTSGTTGKPKGVIVTHGALLHNAQLLADALAVPKGCEYLSYIPLSWLTEQWVGVTLGLMLPMRVNFAERPDQIQEAIRELACELVFLGPRQWENLAARVHTRMLDAPRWRQALVDWGVRIGERVRVAALEGRSATLLDRCMLPVAETLVLRPLREQLGLKRARIALTGGAAMAPDVFRLFAGIGVTLRNLYGCSEYGVISAHIGARLNAETIGQPVTAATAWGSGLELRLVDDGELQLRGGCGFSGYWGKPDKTAERMDGDWYRTGDALGRSEDQRDLIYFDRLEHMSKLAGGQTYPKQFIEIRLRFSPYIKEVMVVGDERHGFVSALVNIDGEVFSHWAEREGLSFTTFTDLSQRPEVVERVSQEIARVNQALPAHARVLRFANLPKELDPDEGELTRTRKLKREFIEERYRALIDALYGPDDRVDLEVPVRYQDGRSAVLRAQVRLGGDANAHTAKTRQAP